MLNAHSDSSYVGPLLLRLSAGFYFLALGFSAYLLPQDSVSSVIAYSRLPESIASLYTWLGSYLFTAIGCCIVIGFLTRPLALVAGLLLLPLILAAGLGAGAFSPTQLSLNDFIHNRLIYKDVVVLSVCFVLYLIGPGSLAADQLLMKFYAKEKPLSKH